MTREDMKENCRAIVQHVINGSPPGMEVTVIFSRKATGDLQCASSITTEAALIEVLKALLDSHPKKEVILRG